MTSPRLRSGNSILRKTPTSKQTSVAVSLHLLTLAYSYFAEIEQAAFTPSHTVDGWAPSADPVLQARLFSYSGALYDLPPSLRTVRQMRSYRGHILLDTHRYRLGVNHMVGGLNGFAQQYFLADRIPGHLANPGECTHQRSRQLPARRRHECQRQPGITPELSLYPAEDSASRAPVR